MFYQFSGNVDGQDGNGLQLHFFFKFFFLAHWKKFVKPVLCCNPTHHVLGAFLVHAKRYVLSISEQQGSILAFF